MIGSILKIGVPLVARVLFRRGGGKAAAVAELAHQAVQVFRANVDTQPPEPVPLEPTSFDTRDPLESEAPPGVADVAEANSVIGGRLEELRAARTAGGNVMPVPFSPIARENRFDPLIARAAARFAVPAEIIKGVIATESSFKPEAIREEPRISDRSRGLMQLLEGTARGLGFAGDPRDLHDPEVNVMLGALLLSRLHRRFGTWDEALAAYNGGTRTRGSDGEIRDILKTYIRKVRGHMGRWTGTGVGVAGALLAVGAFLFLFGRVRS